MKRRSILASAIALLASAFFAGCASQSAVSPGAVNSRDCCCCCCCDPNCEPGCCPECPPDCVDACCDAGCATGCAPAKG